MSRRKTNANDIQNPEHYFNRYIAMEVLHDQQSQLDYNARVVSYDEMISGGENSARKMLGERWIEESEERFFEEKLSATDMLAWIAYIENTQLHKAICTLHTDQKILITLRYRYCYTQSEVAEFFHIRQQNVSKRERAILKKIKKVLEKGCEKP